MWTRVGIHILPALEKTFQPNHFAPLVEFKPAKGERIHQQCKITGIFKSAPLEGDKTELKANSVTLIAQ